MGRMFGVRLRVNLFAVLRAHASKRGYMRPARVASETVFRYPRTSRRLHTISVKQATRPDISVSGTSIAGGTGPGPVPAEHRGGYDYWLASNVLEFTSDAYQTTLYDNDNKPVDLPGYRVDALTDAVIRYVDGHQNRAFLSFYVLHRTAPSEPLGRLSAAGRVSGTVYGEMDTAGSCRVGWLDTPAFRRLLRYGEKVGRSTR